MMEGSAMGLPDFVSNFLRHMQTYQHHLKWTVTDNTHKVSLTLQWSFTHDAHINRDDDVTIGRLRNKLNKTLSMAQIGARTGVPPDVTRLLETAPKKNRRTRLRQRLTSTFGALRTSLSLSRTSLDDLASQNDSKKPLRVMTSPPVRRHTRRAPPLSRNNSLHSSEGAYRSRKTNSAPYSPTRSTEYSFPGGSSEADTCYSADELDYATPADQPYICFPTDVVFTTTNHMTSQRAIVAYRSTPDIARAAAMEAQMAEQRRVVAQPQQEVRRVERTVLDWSKIVTGRCSKPSNFKHTNNKKPAPPRRQAAVQVGNKMASKKPEVKRKPRLFATRSQPTPYTESPLSLPTSNNSSKISSPLERPPRFSPAPTHSSISTTFYAEADDDDKSNDDVTQDRDDVIKCLSSCNKILNRYETEIT